MVLEKFSGWMCGVCEDRGEEKYVKADSEGVEGRREVERRPGHGADTRLTLK